MTKDGASRHCQATTKAGKRCKGWALTGGTVCLAHNPEAAASVGFVAANGKGGRKPVPKPTEMARQLMVDSFLLLHGAHFRTLGFGVEIDDAGVARLVPLANGGAKLHGTSQRDGEINMSEHDDLGAQMKAANDLLDRHFGRPKQAVAVTGADGGAIMLRVGQMLDAESALLADRLVERLAIEAANEEAS